MPKILYQDGTEDLKLLQNTALNTVCRISNFNKDTSGSGVLYQRRSISGGYLYRVLTAAHVVEKAKEVGLTFYISDGRPATPKMYFAAVEIANENIDVAIVTFSSTDYFAEVANLLPSDKYVERGQHVYTIGCGNFHEPYVADGRIMGYHISYYGYVGIYVVGPVIYGDSGGGIFCYVDKKPYVAGILTNLMLDDGKPIYTMGFSSPISGVAEWLKFIKRSDLLKND